jgi:hypothetical protein
MMSFKQNLSLLFWLYRSKAGKDGKAPIYARITISGRDTDIAIGNKLLLILQQHGDEAHYVESRIFRQRLKFKFPHKSEKYSCDSSAGFRCLY